MRSLTPKLTLAFLAVSLLGIILAAAFVAVETRRRFQIFVASQDQRGFTGELLDYYQAHGGWAGVEAAFDDPPGGEGRRPIFVVDVGGVVVLSGADHALGTQVSSSTLSRGIPLVIDGEVVGTLVLADGEFGSPPPRSAFLGPFERGLFIGAGMAALAALALGILLARSLTQPLRDLTTATRAVAAGNLAGKVEVRSKDELGELAESFNQMSADLAHSRNLRRQMTADIAHELRTPLSLILGHSEALSDGVLPATPEALHVIHDEAQRLSRLVEDLRLLALSEAQELRLAFERLSPRELLERAATAHTPQARQNDVVIKVDVAPGLADVRVDPDRITQVLDNLIGNALRYAPPQSAILLTATNGADTVEISVQDSGPGVPDEELPWIFDRFYRGDKARQRHEGGAGLGLAIARSIVEAHGGRIRAESAPGQGLRVTIEIPAQPAQT